MIKRHLLWGVLFLSPALFFLNPVFAGSAGDIRIKYSYNFKECRGYCEGEIIIENRQAVFKKASRFTQRYFPTIRKKRLLTNEEYATLKNILEATEFGIVKERYGCPDCYGQGSERLEIEAPHVSVNVDMDYSSSPDPLNSLVAFIRSLWMTFEAG